MSSRRTMLAVLAMFLLSGTTIAGDAPELVLAKLVDWTKTEAVDCPDGETEIAGLYHRVCGISKLPPEKISKKALRYFDSLGTTLRTDWDDGEQTGTIGGGCIFDGGTLFVVIARTGSLGSEEEPFYNVDFAVLVSKSK